MALCVNHCTPEFVALLLWTVLLSRGAANCPKPPEKDHIVLTDESLLINEYSTGTVVSFACTNGYETDSGSDSIKCTGTEWTEPELLCKRKNCGHPEAQPNMEYVFDKGTLFGDRVKIVCREGYRVVGSSYKDCYPNGWIGRTKCVPITCELPSKVNNGQHSWLSAERPTYGQVIHYMCDSGFTLHGHSHHLCHGRGVYNATPPMCEEDSPTTATSRPTTFTIQHTTSTPRPSVSGFVNGGKHTFATTEDNPVNTETSGSASPTLVADSIPATHGNMGELNTKKDTEGDINNAVSSGHKVVVASVLGTLTVVLIVLTVILAYRHHRRSGSYDTQEDLKPGLLQFQFQSQRLDQPHKHVTRTLYCLPDSV